MPQSGAGDHATGDTDHPGRNAETDGAGECDQDQDLTDQPDHRTGLNRTHRASVSERYADNTENSTARFMSGAWEAAAGVE
jgi:hypothetical protein